MKKRQIRQNCQKSGITVITVSLSQTETEQTKKEAQIAFLKFNDQIDCILNFCILYKYVKINPLAFTSFYPIRLTL